MSRPEDTGPAPAGPEPRQSIVADGRRRLLDSEAFREARALVEREVRGELAGQLAAAEPVRALLFRLRMRREISRRVADEIERHAPRGGLYLQGRGRGGGRVPGGELGRRDG